MEFNCLGIETKTNLTLQINIALHSPIKLFIEKECSKGLINIIIFSIETFVDRIEEAIFVEEHTYGFLKVILVIIIFVFGSWCLVVICIVMSGKKWEEAIPCCKNCFRYFSNETQKNTIPPANKDPEEKKIIIVKYCSI